MLEITSTTEQSRVPVTVFHLKGSIDMDASNQLEKRAKEAIAAGTRYVLLDFKEVSFMSSAGIRALNIIFRALDASTGINSTMAKSILDGSYKSPHLKLLNPAPNVAEVLNVVGMSMFIEIYDDLQRALDSF